MAAPSAVSFEPTGTGCGRGGLIVLTYDELEALRLADLLGFYHEKAALEMGVSRATFSRIVEAARKKAADALINGRPLAFVEGNIVLKGELHMPQRDGTGPMNGGKGRGLGPCGCGQRRGQTVAQGATAGRGRGKGRLGGLEQIPASQGQSKKAETPEDMKKEQQ